MKVKHMMKKTEYQKYNNYCRKQMEEGHAPTSSFFNSLKAKNTSSKIREMEIDGQNETDQNKIEEHVV